jgi:hypothetical protein
MHSAGHLPEDAPDPAVLARAELRAFPVEVLTLVAQPTVEEWEPAGVQRGMDGSGLRESAVSLTFTLIRNPADRSAPENLAELDDDTRRAVEEIPPWPRPPWLFRLTERLRYPQLWEAVRTSWYRRDFEPSLDEVLLEHVNEVLRTQFRVERGLEGRIGGLDPAPDVTAASIQRDAEVTVDGAIHRGIRIDTDPHVYAVAVRVGEGRTLTAVVPRDELGYVTLAFRTCAKSDW